MSQYGLESPGFTGGSGYLETHSRDVYAKLQEGYIRIIPDDNSYIGRIQRGQILAAPKLVKPLELKPKIELSTLLEKPDYLMLGKK